MWKSTVCTGETFGLGNGDALVKWLDEHHKAARVSGHKRGEVGDEHERVHVVQLCDLKRIEQVLEALRAIATSAQSNKR